MTVQLKVFLCCLLVIYSGRSDPVEAEDPVKTVQNVQPKCEVSCGMFYLTTNMRNLGSKLLKQQSEIKQLINEKFQEQERRLQNSEQSIKLQIERMMDNQKRMERNIKQEQAQISSMLTNMGDAANHNFSTVLDDLRSVKIGVKALPVRSCSDPSTEKSGQYWLQPFEGEAPFAGYCEQTKFGGGWLVVQHRFDGSVDFYRNWTEYRDGFGRVNSEFWLGLEKVHRLTSASEHALLVEVKSFEGKYGYAMYDSFELGSEAENYALKKLGAYRGTAGDSLQYHKGNNFTTADRDSDRSPFNCASDQLGAWWYEFCSESHLNGKYIQEDSKRSNNWYHFNNDHRGLKMTRMLIKQVQEYIPEKKHKQQCD